MIDIAEQQWRYIGQLIEKLRDGEATAICCTPDAMARFEAERTEAAKKTVWYQGGCNSWYLDSRGIPASWPWTFERFLAEMATPRWEDLECVAS